MRPFSLELAEASTSELVEVMETAALELAGRVAPESGIACMEIGERLGRTIDVSESALSGLVGRVHSTGVHKAWALPSTASWLVDRLGMARGRANERVTLAKQLPRIPLVAKMLAAQELPLGFAHVIVDCVQRLDEGEDLEAGVQILLELHQAGCPVSKVAQAGHRIKDLVAERLGKEPEDVKRDPEKSWLQKSRSGFGGAFWKGWFNAEDSAAIEEIIDPIAKPTMANDDRNLSQRTADALCSAVTGGNRGAGITLVVDLAAWTITYGTTYPFGDHLTDQWRTPASSNDVPSASTQAQASADAPTTGAPQPSGPAEAQTGRCVVNPNAVRGRVPAQLLNGSPVSAEDVRRMAIYAGISVLLISDGIPLYLGREARLGSPGQRKALEALYETCAVKTCQTPGHLCEIHHLNGGWKTGTPTDIDQLVLVCKWHNCWFEDHPDQVLESRDEHGRVVISILPPHWASGRGFKPHRSPAHRTDVSGYDNPPVYNEQTARDIWLTPAERPQRHTATAPNDQPPGQDRPGDGTADTRGP